VLSLLRKPLYGFTLNQPDAKGAASRWQPARIP